VCWLFFRHHLFQPDDGYILAGDEVVVPKREKRPSQAKRKAA
jgi:hypothetical protein